MTARNGPSAAAENCWETEELGEAILETTAALKKQLNTVFWIGGSPCSGKSSIAQALAESYSCRTYLCDDAYEAHLESARPETQPLMSQVAAMTWDDIWMHSAEFLVEREVKFYEEEFLMIVRDLLALPPHPPLLAEGTALLPGLVSQVSPPGQAIWVVPTEEFQREHYARRPWVDDILRQCRHPAQAFENWMARDSAYAKLVIREAQDRGLKVVKVDGSTSLAENVQQVARWFGW